MPEETEPLRRISWRDAVGPARHGSLAGWELSGPGGLVAYRLRTAFTPLRRLRGLLGQDPLGPEEALLILPCAQVHGFGMSRPFDAVFCDDDLRVLDVATVRPRRMSRHVRGASCCFELPEGRAEECGIEPGAQLSLTEKR